MPPSLSSPIKWLANFFFSGLFIYFYNHLITRGSKKISNKDKDIKTVWINDLEEERKKKRKRKKVDETDDSNLMFFSYLFFFLQKSLIRIPEGLGNLNSRVHFSIFDKDEDPSITKLSLSHVSIIITCSLHIWPSSIFNHFISLWILISSANLASIACFEPKNYNLSLQFLNKLDLKN